MAQQGAHIQTTTTLPRNPSTATLPPAYDLLMGGPSEPPPPSYEEAMFLIGDDKLRPFLENRDNNMRRLSDLSNRFFVKKSLQLFGSADSQGKETA